MIEYRTSDVFPGIAAGSDGSLWRWKGKGAGPGASSPPAVGWERILWEEAAARSGDRSYRRASVWCQGRRGSDNYGVSEVVCTAFHGPCPPGMVCCHENDVPCDN